MYLCYDLKGIQSFIFQVPRLKHIVGGSALIDLFDHETVPQLARRNGWKLIASAGGKGAFQVSGDEAAGVIQNALIAEAHSIGADIRFGLDEDFTEAALNARRLYCFLPTPNELDGHPCPESGLYPSNGKGAHRVIKRRDWSKGESIARRFEDRLKPALEGVKNPVFARDVDDTSRDGLAGHRALGSRNRWAVICMDGNDMGSQFRAMKDIGIPDEAMCTWLERMSAELDECSTAACVAGMNRVLEEWARDPGVARSLKQGKLTNSDGETVVPLRPLVVGGDDIAVLCHAKYAAEFVLAASRKFTDESEVRAKRAHAQSGVDLWPGTNGSLTISAGILYCGTTMPLASAIPYTETLLASAKSKGRQAARKDSPRAPVPPCVDFEAVTETLLDHPLARRKRDLTFLDGDLGNVQVELTQRPYTLDDFERLTLELREPQVLKNVPNTILHQLRSGLRRSHSDRRVFYARLGKHQSRLVAALDEGAGNGLSPASRWRRGQAKDLRTGQPRDVLSTDLIDLAILAEEGRRMEWSDE